VGAAAIELIGRRGIPGGHTPRVDTRPLHPQTKQRLGVGVGDAVGDIF
jgi:hypothetical protein